MENIDHDKLYADTEYRFTYVSNFMDFGKLFLFFTKHTCKLYKHDSAKS